MRVNCINCNNLLINGLEMGFISGGHDFSPVPSFDGGKHSSYSQRFTGHKLLQEIDDFYISYGNWRTEYPENFQCFSLIKRIAEVSINGGGYLSDQDEKELVASLNEIREGLYAGNIKHQHIPSSMNQLIISLIEKNPKAKLVAYVIELEYFFHDDRQPQIELKNMALGLISTILTKVTPLLSDMNAHAAAKELSMLLTRLMKNPHQGKEILHTLETAIKNWL